MNEFQQAALDAVTSAVVGHSVGAVATKEAEGKQENYIALSFARGGDKYEVFLYMDEIGYFLNRRWQIFETSDYDSPSQLIAAVCNALDHDLSAEPQGTAG